MKKMAHANNSKLRLLDAATALVSRSGAGNLTLDGVAAEANMSKGGVLYHFPNKQALLDAMLENLLLQVQARHADLTGSGLSTLSAWIVAQHTSSQKERQTAMALLAGAAEDPALLAKARPTMADNAHAVREAADDPDLATILFLAAEGLRFLDMLQVLPLSTKQCSAVHARMLELAANV